MQLGYGIVGLTISSTIGKATDHNDADAISIFHLFDFSAVFLKETYASDKWIRWRKLLINPETQEDIMAANSLLDIFTEASFIFTDLFHLYFLNVSSFLVFYCRSITRAVWFRHPALPC